MGLPPPKKRQVPTMAPKTEANVDEDQNAKKYKTEDGNEMPAEKEAVEWPSLLSRRSWMGIPTAPTPAKAATAAATMGDDEKKEDKDNIFLKGLVDKDGSPVDEASLQGKIVLLYFSSSWCSACVAFTPVLSVLFEEDEDDTFAVVFVSSDDTAEQCQKYYQKKHADWFLVPFQDKDQRQNLKKKYGVFAGKEQVLFPGTTRKSGIPTLVVVDRKGTCLHLLDCDNPKVHDEIAMKGTSFLDQWKDCKWE